MEDLQEDLVVQEEPVVEEPQEEETPFVPAPAGYLYAEVDENHKLIIKNQVVAFEEGIPAVEYESAWNGELYEKGYAPAKPQETINKERIIKLKAQLDSTDYVVIKIAEAETIEEQNMLREHYSDIIINRKHWREEINELENNS